LKQRGLYRHRQLLFYLALMLFSTGAFAVGVACGQVFGKVCG
jgi:hypothetical protein